MKAGPQERPEPIRAYRLLSPLGAAAHRVKEAKRALRRKWGWVALPAGVLLIVASVLLWRFVILPVRAPPVASVQKMAFPLPDSAEFYDYVGRPEEAIRRVKEAMRLNPYHPNRYWLELGWSQFVAHDDAGAVETLRKMSPLGEGRSFLAGSLAYLGRMEEARAESEKVLKDNPLFSASYIVSTYPFLHDKDREHFLEGYVKAGLPR